MFGSPLGAGGLLPPLGGRTLPSDPVGTLPPFFNRPGALPPESVPLVPGPAVPLFVTNLSQLGRTFVALSVVDCAAELNGRGPIAGNPGAKCQTLLLEEGALPVHLPGLLNENARGLREG